MTPRLDSPPKMGEEVAPVGFGRCALSPDGIKRKERSGGTIRALTGETMHLDAAIAFKEEGRVREARQHVIRSLRLHPWASSAKGHFSTLTRLKTLARLPMFQR